MPRIVRCGLIQAHNELGPQHPLATIKKAMNGLDANGKPAGLGLTDFQSQLRNDPRWKQTNAAQNNVMTAGLQVLRHRTEGCRQLTNFITAFHSGDGCIQVALANLLR